MIVDVTFTLYIEMDLNARVVADVGTEERTNGKPDTYIAPAYLSRCDNKHMLKVSVSHYS